MLFQTVKSTWVLVPRIVRMLRTSLLLQARLALQLVLAHISGIVNRVPENRTERKDYTFSASISMEKPICIPGCPGECQRTTLALDSNITVSHNAVKKCVWTDVHHLSAPCQSRRVPGPQGTWGWARGSQLEVAYHELSPLCTTPAA